MYIHEIHKNEHSYKILLYYIIFLGFLGNHNSKVGYASNLFRICFFFCFFGKLKISFTVDVLVYFNASLMLLCLEAPLKVCWAPSNGSLPPVENHWYKT